jgi:hypothetical protein
MDPLRSAPASTKKQESARRRGKSDWEEEGRSSVYRGSQLADWSRRPATTATTATVMARRKTTARERETKGYGDGNGVASGPKLMGQERTGPNVLFPEKYGVRAKMSGL